MSYESDVHNRAIFQGESEEAFQRRRMARYHDSRRPLRDVTAQVHNSPVNFETPPRVREARALEVLADHFDPMCSELRREIEQMRSKLDSLLSNKRLTPRQIQASLDSIEQKVREARSLCRSYEEE